MSIKNIVPGGIMKSFIKIIILIGFIYPASCLAQDPGLPDSMIIGNEAVPYMPGQYITRYIHVNFVTDDTIDNLGMFGLTWDSPDNQITPTGCVWRYPFTAWDEVYDSVNIENHVIGFILYRDIGGDENPYLFTNGQRLWGFDIRFVISPNAQEQVMWIDSAQAIWFNTTQGSFIPQFVRGSIDYGGHESINEINAIPVEFELSPNYPNPFNGQTIINFELTKQSQVKIEIYNITGALIGTLIEQRMPAGRHKALWDASAFSSGVYFCKLTIKDKTQTQKMLLIKQGPVPDYPNYI
jgi:hypothetical protein